MGLERNVLKRFTIIYYKLAFNYINNKFQQFAIEFRDRAMTLRNVFCGCGITFFVWLELGIKFERESRFS